MCEIVADMIACANYGSARELRAAGVMVLDEDIHGWEDAGPDGLIHTSYQMINGEKVPAKPYSPLDLCLCSVDTAAALYRTPAWFGNATT